VQLALSHFTSIPRIVVAPLFLLLFPAFAAMPIPASSPMMLFGILFGLVALIAAYAIRHEAGPVYAIAAFLAVATEGVWSVDNVTRERLTTAMIIYAAFALLFLAVPVIARRLGRNVVSQWTMLVLILGSIGVLFFLSTSAVAQYALPALAILLVVINVGAIAEARSRQNTILAAASILLSWIVITIWCANALTPATLVAALMLIGGFALLALTGAVFIGRGRDGDASTTYLGLAGHLFLFAVAVQPSLAFPPWPLFTAMFVLDLAIGIAALYLRRDRLMTAAMAASQIVLMAWAADAKAAPWPVVGFVAAIAVCAMALIWFRIDRRFTIAAIVSLFAGDLVVIIAGSVSEAPLFVSLLVSHLVIGIAMLAVAWLTEGHDIALAAMAFFALAEVMFRPQTPAQHLGFAAALYALFIV
ncbi:MAG: hypothetical protein ACRD3J_01030, partial [Thermoanaerobaculia bacterium]